MNSKKPKETKDEDFGKIKEQIKIGIHKYVSRFMDDKQITEYEFPSSLHADERKYIHRYAQSMGLKTKSRGKGIYRFLTIYKSNGSTIISSDAGFNLGLASQHHIMNLLQKCPITDKERKDLQIQDRGCSANAIQEPCRELNCTTGRLGSTIAQIPPPPRSHELFTVRQNLPIFEVKNEIINQIWTNQVTLISGETGCGKTTQVPQYILEHCHHTRQPCRIVVAEPRRISALTVADRVAQERGENIGQTVGYQIRLESKVSPRTLLTFCTNGVLLRTLMGSDNPLSYLTHIVIDEVHERDRFGDLLILVLKHILPSNRKIKLILMSATFDSQRYANYFDKCPVIPVPGFSHRVNSYFLADILKSTNYMSPAMRNYKESLKDKPNKQRSLKKWCEKVEPRPDTEMKSDDKNVLKLDGQIANQLKSFEAIIPRDEMDRALEAAWMNGSDDEFKNLIDMFMNESASVDEQHSETGVTALIAAACRGKINYVETFLDLGANITITTANDWDAVKWAKYFNHSEIVDLLEAFWKCFDEKGKSAEYKEIDAVDISEEDRTLLDIYHHSFNDEEVDIDLLLTLLHCICSQTDDEPNRSILIFLPGYDEIVNTRERIVNDPVRFDSSKYILFTLHSQMQSVDQKRVFKSVRNQGREIRKIILSTNIAETSVTIDDIVYVIDCGKVKERQYDPVLGVTMLKSVWISQSNAIQRRGRAGRCRPGVCYYMFSKLRFDNMKKFQDPEILRIPIHELCLQVKLLAPPNISISDFLFKAMDAPSISSMNNSIKLLKTIDALDFNEQLTELGLHLLDLPVEPNLGKMILYSVLLKCLDPVLTIVCSLSYRDPFLIPAEPSLKRAAAAARKKLAASTYSDHMILLRGFQSWQKARADGFEASYCQNNYISGATMEMIVGMRAQLLGQLRASGFVRARGPGDIRDLNVNSENWAVVKAALCAGCYPNLIRVDQERMELVTSRESRIRFNPSSVLNTNPLNPKDTVYQNRAKYLKSLPSDWFIYEEMTRIGRVSYARCCTLISPINAMLFSGPSRLQNDIPMSNDIRHMSYYQIEKDSDSENEEPSMKQKVMVKIDDWISFNVDPDIAQLALGLRHKWHSLFLRRMSSPSKPLSQMDDFIVKAVVEVISAEEQSLNMQQPVGIGQRPRPMATEFCPPYTSASINSPVGRSSFDTSRSTGYSPRQNSRVSPRSFTGRPKAKF